VRVRDPGDQVSQTALAPNAVDTSIAGSATLELAKPPYSSRLSYSPYFGVNSIGRDAQNLNLAHTVALSGGYTGPRQTVAFTDTTVVGFRSFSPLIGVDAN